ncbi:MAG: zinc ribbon domain-containing protein [Chthoniobacterales bacterium]
MTKLVCTDCQHENEVERIYCHNCGARLDRTKVIKEKIEQGRSDAKAQEHLKKLFDPRRGRAKRLAAKLTKTIVGALVCAGLILMLLPPDLPPESKTYTFAPMINMDLVSAVSSHRTTPLVYDEAQVNSYLAVNVRRKDSPASKGLFPLRRIQVQFDEGRCSVSTERQLYGLPIYSGGSYRVSIEQGKIIAAATGGYIGRLAIPSSLMKIAGPLMQKAWETMAREKGSVAKLSGIEFHPQSVTLIAAR